MWHAKSRNFHCFPKTQAGLFLLPDAHGENAFIACHACSGQGESRHKKACIKQAFFWLRSGVTFQEFISFSEVSGGYAIELRPMDDQAMRETACWNFCHARNAVQKSGWRSTASRTWLRTFSL
jgi:hypothetical protein